MTNRNSYQNRIQIKLIMTEKSEMTPKIIRTNDEVRTSLVFGNEEQKRESLVISLF